MMDLLGILVQEEIEEEITDERSPYNLQLLPDGSPVGDEMPEEAPICPRVGEEYQVEVSDSPLEFKTVLIDNCFLIGLPVPLSWVDFQEDDGPVPVPSARTSHWSESEKNGLVLGLYIFGKNLRLVRQFVESKSLGDVLAYYYGVLYKSEMYKKWADCRKARTRKCIVGSRIFTGWRQQELVSRLLSTAPQEKHDSVLEAIKTFNENTDKFEEFIFSLRSTIGLQTFIDAVAIGKGREDLTSPGPDLGRAAHTAPARPEIPSGKACSALSPADIVKFLTGDFRLSKARSNDLFWEAVWPRLLARGWHSEQPRDLIGSKNSLVFLMPDIKKFSRKLMKGEHYYDSVSDVLKKVAAEPGLLEIDSIVAGNEDGEWGSGAPPVSPKEYLRLKVRPHDDSDLMRFMVVDTSMLPDGGRIRVRELKSLPADIRFGTEPALMVGQSRIVVSSDSSDSQNDNMSGVRRQNSGSSMASDVNLVKTNSPHVEGMDLGAGPSTAAAGNGHVETTSIANDVAGHFGNFSQSSKPRQHKYLSPVPTKRRRLSGCKHQGASQKGLSIDKGNSNKADHNGLSSSAKSGTGRECNHPQRKRNIKFLVRDVMKEETEPDLGTSGMVETVQVETKVEPGPSDKTKEVGPSTSQRKRKVNHLVKEPKVAETERKPGLEVVGGQINIESHSSVQVSEPAKEAGPTKRKRKVTFLFREALEREHNVMPHLIDGSQTGGDLTQHDSGPSKKPKKVVRRKPKPSAKEVKKEIELPSVSVKEEPLPRETKEIEMPKLLAIKEEPQDFKLNEPENAPTDASTSGQSSALVPSEPNAMTSGRRLSTRNRPPTVRALEAVANGFLGGPKQRSVSASPRQGRKSGEASRSRKVKERVIPTPSEDASVMVLSPSVGDESCKGNGDQPVVVSRTGDVQHNAKALDHMVKVDPST